MSNQNKNKNKNKNKLGLREKKELLVVLMTQLREKLVGQKQDELKDSPEWHTFKASLCTNSVPFDNTYPGVVGDCTPDQANEFKKYVQKQVEMVSQLSSAFMAGTGIVQTEVSLHQKLKRKFDDSSTDEQKEAVAEALKAGLITTEQAESIAYDENFSAKLGGVLP